MAKTLVLFVHGLGGDGSATWGSFPSLLREDLGIGPHVEVAVFNYPTQGIRWFWQKKSIRIQDLAQSIKTEIDIRHKAFDQIVLVCHSMGGTICQKYLLEELRDNKTLRVKAVALYGVPTDGSEIAKWATLVSWEHRHLKQLRRDSDLLENIRQEWGRACAKQHFEVVTILGGQDSVIVRAVEVGPDVKFLADKGHIDLVKPTSREDMAYLILRELLVKSLDLNEVADRRRAKEEILVAARAPIEISDGSRNRPLFDIYRPNDEPFYLIRREDALVAGTIKSKNIWLYGSSGLGKTVSLMRGLYQEGGKFKLVSLGHYLGREPKGVFSGFYDGLSQDLENRTSVENLDWPATIEAVAARLEELSSEIDWILIEEMPLGGEGEFREFFSRLFALLMLYSRRNRGRPLSLAFSSINDPRIGFDGAHRMADVLKVIKFNEWRNVDLERLSLRITDGLQVIITPEKISAVVAAAQGSPRFVKAFFTNYMNFLEYCGNEEDPFYETLNATRLEMMS